jgi:hypothetical protein
MAILSGYIESGRALDDFQDISAAIRNKTAAISAQSGKKFSRVTDAMQFKRSKKPAELAGRIEVNRTERQEWEGFELVEIAKGKVALKYQTGYLCAEYGGGGAVNADRPEIGDWERWNLVDNKDGTFSLQAANGSFLCAEEGGDQALVADREKIGKWESFVLERVGTKSYLKASSGKYVSAQP